MNGTGGRVATLENVFHRYGKQVALRGVSIELRAGELLGLIGPDGVGKSTLLGILAGAKKVQPGPTGTNRVSVFGGDFTRPRHRGAVCAQIAYMPQGLGRNLYPDLTVRENIAFFSRLFGQGTAERARRTSDLLAATGLAPFGDRAAQKLSGGMRQKLGLCCALIHDPDLLILDEPTTGVDPVVASAVLGLGGPHSGRAAGHERDRCDGLHGRSRAVRPPGGDERRRRAGDRHAGRNPVADRLRHA